MDAWSSQQLSPLYGREVFRSREADETHARVARELKPHRSVWGRGNVDAVFNHGPWQFLWGANLIGAQSSVKDLLSSTTTDPTITQDGVNYLVKARVGLQAIHHTSLKYSWKDYTFLIGVQNVFDKSPPNVSTINSGLGLYNYIGTSLENSQYNEGFLGRRGFVRVSKKF